MTFAGLNYLAIVIAAVVAWLAGAGWYMSLSKIWLAAQGLTAEKMHEAKSRPGAHLPFIYALVAELVMAWVLAGMVGHLGTVTIRSAVISALFVWGGFVITTMLVNYSFSGRRYLLTAIDAGHWLIVLVLMGVVIGWMGV